MRKGQALIVVLLFLAIVMTVGLAVVARVTTQLSISSTQEESSRALLAAESGIEYQLGNLSLGVSSGSIPLTTPGMSSSFTLTKTILDGPSMVIPPESLVAGESTTIFLSDHDVAQDLILDPTVGQYYSGGSILVCWNKQGADVPTAEVSIFYRSIGVNPYKVSRKAYGPGGDSIYNDTANCPAELTAIAGGRSISWADFGLIGTDKPLILRVRLLGNGSFGAQVAVKAETGKTFPSQGVKVKSVGESGSATKAVEVFQKYPDPLSFFDIAVYSGGNLVKN